LRPEAKEAEEQKGRKGENGVVFIINSCMSVVYINSWDNFPTLKGGDSEEVGSRKKSMPTSPGG